MYLKIELKSSTKYQYGAIEEDIYNFSLITIWYIKYQSMIIFYHNFSYMYLKILIFMVKYVFRGDTLKKGYCHICQKYKDLTYEHIPPRKAFNYTRAKSIECN